VNPYVPALVAVLIAGASFGAGWRVNGWRIKAEAASVEHAALLAGQAATEAAVAAIKEIRPVYQTITRQVEREIRVEPRYVDPSCSHTDTTWGLLDSAYQAAGGKPFGSGAGLPESSGPGG
jgi:hypothetical protein